MQRYIFRSTWHLKATADEVYAALADVEAYPIWWPQVRGGRRLDDTSGEIVCRSLLPYDLTFIAHRIIEDPVNRVLRAMLSGDLNGISEWNIASSPHGTTAVFDEDVTVGSGLLRTAGIAARPALKFNHDLMMRSGERGLRRHLLQHDSRAGAADRTQRPDGVPRAGFAD
jgi:hypothetical protein